MPAAAIMDDRACAAFLHYRDANTCKWMPIRLEKAKKVQAAECSSRPPQSPALGAVWIDTNNTRERAYEYRQTLKAADDLAKIERGEADPNKPRPCPPQVWNMVCGAVLTGLAQADLIRLTWPMVCEDVIDLAGGRTKTGQEAMPPVLEEARALFDRIEADQRAAGIFNPDGVVFLSSRGQGWTKDGFKSSWACAKAASGIAEALHFHDLRGTAATQFMVRGHTSDQVDLFMGWKPGESAHIRRKYIDARNVAKGVQTFLKGATRARLAAAN
jgi:integrase